MIGFPSSSGLRRSCVMRVLMLIAVLASGAVGLQASPKAVQAAAAIRPAASQDWSPANLECHLGSLWQAERAAARNGPAAAAAAMQAVGEAVSPTLRFDPTGRVYVQVWTRVAASAVAEALSKAGFQVLNQSEHHHLMEGSLPVDSLADAAAVPGVLSITPMLRPVTCLGSCTTQGDELLKGMKVRDELRYDGTGVKIGVLSDSVGQVGGGLPDSIGKGDLPVDVQILRDYLPDWLSVSVTDEGRALLEIVHDLAPGAKLAFHTGLYGQLDFAGGIRALARAGCRVLVDDLFYFDEPWFQDGIIAQAVEEVADRHGVTYVSAAGNWHGRVHAADYRDVNGFHNFDASGGEDTRLSFTVPTGAWGIVCLQWSDPWYTTNGVKNDFDLYAYDQATGTLRISAETDNVQTQQPMERLEWRGAPYAEARVDIQIKRRAGSGPVAMKLLAVSGVMNEYNDGTSVVGHASSEKALAAGAVSWLTPDQIEDFSSRGPTVIYSDPSGNPLPEPAALHKPDLVGVDNVNNSFLGQDIPEDADDCPNFPGTSAAAPHVAGIAALMLSANGALAPAQVRSILRSTASRMPGQQPWSPDFGHGRVDAWEAVREAIGTPDTIGPVASLVSPPERTARHVRFAKLQFSEAVRADTAVATANYELRGAGPDGLPDTGDDVVCALAAAYDHAQHAVRLDVSDPAEGLPVGAYCLTVRSAIWDEAGNPLNGGLDLRFCFEVTQWSEDIALVLPPQSITALPDVAVIDAGRAAVAWYGAAGQAVNIYDENAARIAGPLIVEDGGAFGGPAVCMAPVGSTVVAHDFRWHAQGSDVFASRFAPDGAFLGRTIVDDRWNPNGGEDVACASDGGFAVVWAVHPWPGEFGAYARSFDRDGNPRCEAVQIGPVSGQDLSPRVAADAIGNLVVTWNQGNPATSSSDVYAQRFDGTCMPLGPPFRVNESEGDHYLPSIAMRPTGEFVIAWLGGPSAYTPWPCVRARRFASDGTSLGGELGVRCEDVDLWSEAQTVRPAVATNERGDFVVAFHGKGHVPEGPCVQRFDSSANPIGRPFCVGGGIPGASAGMDGDGSLLIAWLDAQMRPHMKWYVMPLPELPDLQITELSAPPAATTGHRIELHSMVFNDGVDSAAPSLLHYFISPDAQITGTGNDRRLWIQACPEPEHPDELPAQELPEIWGGTYASNTRGARIPADLASGTYWIGAIADVGGVVPERDESNNIRSVQIEVAAPPCAGSGEMLMNATLPGNQVSAHVAAVPHGFVVVWSGAGPEDDEGIFLRRFSKAMIPMGPEERVNQIAENRQSWPALGADAQGGLVVVWTHEAGGENGQDIHARRYHADGAPATDEFLVNTENTTGSQYMPDVAVLADPADHAKDGRFVSAWLSEVQAPEANSSLEVLLAKSYDRDYDPGVQHGPDAGILCGQFQVSETPAYPMYYYSPYAPPNTVRIRFSPSGGLLVVWADWDGADRHVRYRAFHPDCQPKGELQVTSVGALKPSCAFSREGQGLLVWEVPESQGGVARMTVYGQWMSADLERVGEPFQVSSYTGHGSRSATSSDATALDDGGFVVVWPSGTDWPPWPWMIAELYGQRFAADRSRLGGEWRLTACVPADSGIQQRTPSTAGLGGQSFVVVWGGGRADLGATDVLGKLIGYLPGDSDGDGDVDLDDVAHFQDCASGPELPLTPGCEDNDLDGDADVDQSDFGIFQRCYSGPNAAADPNCAN